LIEGAARERGFFFGGEVSVGSSFRPEKLQAPASRIFSPPQSDGKSDRLLSQKRE
jgi:hypothetical protein